MSAVPGGCLRVSSIIQQWRLSHTSRWPGLLCLCEEREELLLNMLVSSSVPAQVSIMYTGHWWSLITVVYKLMMEESLATEACLNMIKTVADSSYLMTLFSLSMLASRTSLRYPRVAALVRGVTLTVLTGIDIVNVCYWYLIIRYCGEVLACSPSASGSETATASTVCSTVTPFRINFYTDDFEEASMEDGVPNDPTSSPQVGFKLYYDQVKCWHVK